jgi:hypothetical protein
MGDDTVDRVLHDLKIIGCLREGDKICMAEGSLCIMHPSPLNLVWRWSRGDNRTKSIDTIRTVLLDSLAMSEFSIDRVMRRTSISNDSSPATLISSRSSTADTYTTQSTVRRLYKGTQEAVVGLKYLRTTYSGDGNTTASIDVLRERVVERLAAIAAWLRVEGVIESETPASSPRGLLSIESFAGCILLSEEDLRI